MTNSALRLGILKDSGPPDGSIDYTTVVLLHGYACSSGRSISIAPYIHGDCRLYLCSLHGLTCTGIFEKLIPLAARHNARVVLVNRRDYPGSTPYTLEERAVLVNAAVESKTNPLAARDKLHVFMAERAREVYDLLVSFVAQHKIPPAFPKENKGGIVIGGWSFGTGWMLSLLENVASFPVHKVALSRYVRRVIFYGAYCVYVNPHKR